MNVNNEDVPGEIQNLCTKVRHRREEPIYCFHLCHCYCYCSGTPTSASLRLLFLLSSLLCLFLLYLGSGTGELLGSPLLCPFCVFFRLGRGLVTWIIVGNVFLLTKVSRAFLLATGECV